MNIVKTNDYSIFKTIKGNRKVDNKRVARIIDSIKKVGLIPAPIIVNENMEIIDGQGRFQACKKLELPVFYAVVPGIGLDECIAMNISSTNWTITDYVRSFAEQGINDYIRLLKLVEQYGNLGLSVIITAATGKVDSCNERVKSGGFKLSEDEYRNACDTLEYIERFVPVVKQRQIPNANRLYQALCFIHGFDDIDNERMLKAVSDYSFMLGGYSTVDHVMQALERVYNHRLAQRNKVLVFNIYRQYMSEKYGWYEKKYDKKRA